jgi:outer membrane lipoprotein-sorting protein
MNRIFHVTARSGTFLAFLTLVGASAAAQADLDVQELMSKNYAISRVGGATFDATFTLLTKQGAARVRKTVGGTRLQGKTLDQMRFTRFVAPADVNGMSTLVVEHTGSDDDIWIYLPALKKVRRLVAENKKDSFLGTDFSYADVIGYPVADWSYSLLREENLDGQPCWVISGLPKNDGVKSSSGYSKRVDWIQKNNFVTVKSEFWDEAGQLLKSALFGDIRNIDPKAGKWQAMRLEAQNVQTGHSTTIQFGEYKVDLNVDEKMFSTRYLEKQ